MSEPKELDFEERVLLELLRELQSRKRLEQRMTAIEDLFGGPPTEGLASTFDRAFARCQKPGCCLYLRVILTDRDHVCPAHGVDHGLPLVQQDIVLSDEQGLRILTALNLQFEGDSNKIQTYKLNLIQRIRDALK